MVHKGDFIIVKDRDIGDMYCGQTEIDTPNETAINPLVKVVYMLRYPVQHALVYTDVPNENPPLMYGEKARLSFVRRCAPNEETLLPYDDSFDLAIAQAISEAATDAEREILEKHKRRDFGKMRVEIRH